MKLARSSYPAMFALLLLMAIPLIDSFSEKLKDQLFLPIIIIIFGLCIIGLILAIKDKEIIKIIIDERTKKVDRCAVYYSWWFSIIFVFIFGIIAKIYNLSIFQIIYIILIEMFSNMLIFHMYFNFWGKF